MDSFRIINEEIVHYDPSCDEMSEPESVILEQSETARVFISSHRPNKSIKKTQKKRSMEQRSKQKKSHRA